MNDGIVEVEVKVEGAKDAKTRKTQQGHGHHGVLPYPLLIKPQDSVYGYFPPYLAAICRVKIDRVFSMGLKAVCDMSQLCIFSSLCSTPYILHRRVC